MHDGAAASGRSLARSPIITFYRSLQVLVRGRALSSLSLRVLIDTQISRRALVLASGFALSCKNARGFYFRCLCSTWVQRCNHK
jgi:hypothetical protein